MATYYIGDPADLVAHDTDAARFALARRIVASLPAWHADAACAGEPLEWFFPTRGQTTEPGLQICGRCSTRQPCLDEAMADPDLDHGIRGGMTAKARVARRRADRKRKAGTNAQA